VTASQTLEVLPVFTSFPKLFALVCAVAAFTGTGRLAAQDAKAPDLSDLRDAVVAANKRGENVTDIRKSLEVLEKSFAKGWTAPKAGNPAPAELVAIRDAVEAAAKKGENVAEIGKELEAIEKAVTGQAFVRPKPAPEPEPFPTRPNRGGFGGGRGGVVIQGGGGVVIQGNLVINGGRGNSVSVSNVNGNIIIKASQDGVTYSITSPVAADGTKTFKILVTDGDKKVEAEDVAKLPEEYRPTVEKLLKLAGR